MKFKATEIILILFLIFITFLESCKNLPDTTSEQASLDVSEIDYLIIEWNKAHISKNIAALSNLYDNSVLYYGTQTEKNICLENKLSFFNKNTDYYQQITGKIKYEKIDSAEIKCSFVKRVTFNKKTNQYPAYLIFTKSQDKWKITTEGDSVTDRNIGRQIPQNAITGDFNGDGKLDRAWLVFTPESECLDCSGDCTCYIKFSEPSISQIVIQNCIGGNPNNLGDLNKNGSDEIGLLPDWCTSCWRDYNVYTLKEDKWIFAVEPFPTHCYQWEEGVQPIEIDVNKDRNVIIRYSDMTDADIEVKTKSVSIK